jgi:hypothetical protein
MNKIEVAYRYVSNILSIVWFFGLFFMWEGSKPFASVVIGILAANALWFFFLKGVSADVRWIFYFLGINPNDTQISLPSSIAFPSDIGLRFPLMFVLFPKIASDLQGIFCLFMIIMSIYTINRIFIMILGAYVYLEKYMGNNEETDKNYFIIYKKLLNLSYVNNIARSINIAIILIIFVVLFVIFSLQVITFKTTITLFCFAIWVNLILLATSLSKHFVISSICFYTTATVMNQGVYERKELQRIISNQKKSTKLCIIGLFPIYILTGILVYIFYASH